MGYRKEKTSLGVRIIVEVFISDLHGPGVQTPSSIAEQMGPTTLIFFCQVDTEVSTGYGTSYFRKFSS